VSGIAGGNNSTMQQQIIKPSVKPKRFDIFLHGFKTTKLIGRLLKDRRVPATRKLLFLGSVTGFLVLLLFPDAISETFLSVVLPFVGTILGIPIDAGMDWVAFALLIVNLLRFFPEDLVAEHYKSIFG
jgi:hypothetical protein